MKIENLNNISNKDMEEILDTGGVISKSNT